MKLWIIVIAAILLRIFLSLTTYHSDMQVFDVAGKLVAAGNVLTLYDFSSDSAVFNYPPAIYLYHGLLRFLFGDVALPIILKIPYLIFDFLIGFMLFKLSGRKLWAFALWMFNPVSLFAAYMMGQFDIIPTFFIVLSVYFAVKNKLEWSALALGFGIAFKLFPIFLVIPLVILGGSFRKKIKLLSLSAIPYLLLILPYLPSQSFRSTALFASQSSKSLYANIPVSGGEAIILFPAALLFFYLYIWHFKLRPDILRLYLIPLLLFFIFTHYHPQWLIWVTPLLILDLVLTGFKSAIPVLFIFIGWLISLFFFDPSLTIGIFSPVAPVLFGIPSIWELLNIDVDYNLMRSLIQTVFASAAFYQIYRYFLQRDNETV